MFIFQKLLTHVRRPRWQEIAFLIQKVLLEAEGE